MYCVRCGVSLEEGVRECPLCGTPVWNPKAQTPNPHYNPSLYPEERVGAKYTILALLTAVMAIVSLGCLIACVSYYGRASWSAYVVFSCLLVYIVVILPTWFGRYYPVIFLPVSFAAAAGYLLFICLHTGGSWFLSFAFPLTGIVFVFAYLGYWLAKIGFQPRIRLRLLGIYLILLGGATMLIEFFMHISFSLPMFNWSLYSAALFGALGLFLFIASFIKPLRRAMYKKMFI